MTGLVRKVTLLTLCGVMVAGAALAGIPSGQTSELPACNSPTNVCTAGRHSIMLGPYASATGNSAGRAQLTAAGDFFRFNVVVRDISTNFVANANVVVDFNACKRLWLAPGPGVSCTGHYASATASALGVASFAIVGSSENSTGALAGQGDPANIGCAKIFAAPAGVMPTYPGGAWTDLSSSGGVFVATPDENNSYTPGSGSVTGGDAGPVIADVAFCAGGIYLQRTDFDQDGAVTGRDISKFFDILVVLNNPPSTNGIDCGPSGLNNCCGLLNPLP